MESGERYFPDFVVGMNGRPTLDGIALAETKRDFRSVDSLMLFLDEGIGEFLVVEQVLPTLNQPSRSFDVIDLAT